MYNTGVRQGGIHDRIDQQTFGNYNRTGQENQLRSVNDWQGNVGAQMAYGDWKSQKIHENNLQASEQRRRQYDSETNRQKLGVLSGLLGGKKTFGSRGLGGGY